MLDTAQFEEINTPTQTVAATKMSEGNAAPGARRGCPMIQSPASRGLPAAPRGLARPVLRGRTRIRTASPPTNRANRPAKNFEKCLELRHAALYNPRLQNGMRP